MNQTSKVEDSLFSIVHPHISKHTSFFSILSSMIMVLVGITIMIVSVRLGDRSDTLSMVLLTMGVLSILFALYRMFWRSTEVIYIPTGSIVAEGACYMDSCELTELAKLIEQKDFRLSSRMTFKPSGNGRMDYLLSKDHQFAAVQLYQFVPYTYEPASRVFYYTGADAENFARYLVSKQK